MSEPWSAPWVRIEPPKRGTGTQDLIVTQAQAFSLTWSWGSSPGSADVRLVASQNYPSVTPGAYIEVSTHQRTFFGIVQAGPWAAANNVTAPTLRAAGGHYVDLSFLDTRFYLSWDYVFCAFNLPDVRIVNGQRRKRYQHVYPADYWTGRRTYTDAPLSAATIINAILRYNYLTYPNGRAVLGTVWTAVLHAAQWRYPVLEIDCLSGRRLDEVLAEISEQQGLVFTVDDQPFKLRWARKGEGYIDFDNLFPARTDNQALASVLAEVPDRVHVVGDRNRYLVLNLAMRYDWNRNWEEFIRWTTFEEDVFQRATDPATGQRFNAMSNDPDQLVGRFLAAARSREITVAEYAALRQDKDFRDFRLYAGHSRLDMPAQTYLNELVFRAFRPPANIWLGSEVPLTSLMVSTEPIARVSHDPATGAMSWDANEQQDGAGYAIVQGYQIGTDVFRTVNPDRFDLDQWRQAQTLWQAVPFQVDDSGEDGGFIVFEAPIIKSTDLVTQVGDYAVFNCDGTQEIPLVRAALVFEAERFCYTYALPLSVSRDERTNVPGLRGEFVVNSGVITEILYADGKSANQKAIEIGSALLQSPAIYLRGGYSWKLQPDDAIPPLSGLTNRITVNISDQGQVCDVQWTSEWRTNVYRPERELDRFNRQHSLLPGQQELRAQARQERQLAAALRQSPALRKLLTQTFYGRFGAREPLYPLLVANTTGSDKAAAGTPLWRSPEETRAAKPADTTSNHSVFAGVVTAENEPLHRPLLVQASGEALVRVMGPVTVGDTVARSAGHDYLTKQEDGDEPAVGVVRETISTAAVRLVRVALGAGGGSSTGEAVWA